MIIRNYTPFSTLFFESRDVQGRDFHVMVLRGTFNILPDAPLRPDPKQLPIVEADIYHGEPNRSSLYMESDLAPFKPRTDIHINAVAHAPGGRPLPDWVVRVKVGALEKALRVTGPRAWVREGGDWTLTDPEPCLEVPIRYEHAFGGTWTSNWREEYVCRENPVGVGFVGDDRPTHLDRIPAPQIESLEDPIREFGKVYKPEGFGPIARSWQPRLGLAGTFDEGWKNSRWPELPLDFDFAHYNGAHPGLIYPGYVRGDEEISLEGLRSDEKSTLYLPGYKVAVLIRFDDGAITVAPSFMDTVAVDMIDGRVHLTWRATFLKTNMIRSIEPRMTQATGGIHG